MQLRIVLAFTLLASCIRSDAHSKGHFLAFFVDAQDVQIAECAISYVTRDPPHSTSFADEKSPSGPEMAVGVCPQRGPGGLPRHGKGLCRGAGSG